MNRVGKKIFSVFIIAMLLSTQVFSVELDGVFNGTSASTDFGTWDSPRTGSKYFYGGSYAFAFKGANKYQPFFQGESPSAKVGCNGFSISGGFIALLGLDEIKTMLKNSGATLAWGLMMGLEYSMPALAKTFETLRRWAREIQKLLQNSCRLGQLLAEKSPALQKVKGAISNSFVGKADKWLDNKMAGDAGLLKTIENYMPSGLLDSNSSCDSLIADAKQTCINKTSGPKVGLTSRLAASSSMSIASTAIGAFAKDDTPAKNGIGISKLSSFFDNGKVGDKVIVSNADKLQEIQSTILISRLFFGDLGTPFDAIKKITRDTNLATGIAEGQFPLVPDKTKKALHAELNGQIYAEELGMIVIPAVISSEEEAAKALIDGITSKTDSKLCFDNYCNVLDTYLYFIDFSTNPDTKEKIQVLGNLYSDNTSSSDKIKVKWEGAYKESLKAIRTKVNKLTGYAPTYTSRNETSATMADTNFADVKVPLLLPNIDKYIKDIVLLERKAKKETPYSAQLKTLLARQNAYFFATSLIDLLTGKVMNAIGANGDVAGNPDYTKLEPFLTRLLKKSENIAKKIKEDQDNQITYQELAEMFEKINKQIRTDFIKDY